MYSCKPISTPETYLVRHPVLRPGKPLETCCFAGDDLPTTRHFGIFDGEKIIGVLSLFVASNEWITAECQLQFRGMAVLAAYQNKGIGVQLMAYAEAQIPVKKPYFIWLNARERALSFYEKMGYQKIGKPFTIGDIGIHYVLVKLKD
ncbi:MAG: GNAT family N-acetyltransferase [Flavobacterium sp.]|nr:GNAT family N-acetyltransferase [Flavobacterium sp.]